MIVHISLKYRHKGFLFHQLTKGNLCLPQYMHVVSNTAKRRVGVWSIHRYNPEKTGWWGHTPVEQEHTMLMANKIFTNYWSQERIWSVKFQFYEYWKSLVNELHFHNRLKCLWWWIFCLLDGPQSYPHSWQTFLSGRVFPEEISILID